MKIIKNTTLSEQFQDFSKTNSDSRDNSKDSNAMVTSILLPANNGRMYYLIFMWDLMHSALFFTTSIIHLTTLLS